MRAILLMTLAACGAGAGAGGRLRVEPVAADEASGLALGDDQLVFDYETQTIARIGDGGVVRWRREIPGSGVEITAPGNALLFLTTPVPDTGFRAFIVRIDAAKGVELGRVASQHRIGQWLQRGDALYNVGPYSVSRVDPVTGADVWQVKGDFVEFDAQVTDAALWLRCKAGVCGFATSSGAPIATLPHANWPMVTPDGKLLVLQGEAAAGVYDATTGALRWSAPGVAGASVNKTAVSDRWLAVLSSGKDDQAPDHIQVFALGGGAPVWSVSSAKGAYLEYLAAGGDLVVWYDSKDAAIHAVRLPDGARGKVYQLRETFVMSTDASGMAPAVPDGAPSVDGDRVDVTDFGKTHAFRVY